MLPVDHPEFFRRPPPPGQSRESSIRLDAEGRFWHAGEPVRHPGMQAAFATWIRRHPDDGRYVLCNGYDWTYFQVDDVPHFVRSVTPVASSEGEALRLALSDGTEELLDPASLRLGARDALYCRVKGGACEARFTPGAQSALWPYLAEGEAGQAQLEIGGRRHDIAPGPPKTGQNPAP
ncbi:MAG TPA: hypothetical protein VFS67_37150 [Polyangiaceae bacterium]|nr:hypothetical protein [Polyangiaceae bacterium]